MYIDPAGINYWDRAVIQDCEYHIVLIVRSHELSRISEHSIESIRTLNSYHLKDAESAENAESGSRPWHAGINFRWVQAPELTRMDQGTGGRAL